MRYLLKVDGSKVEYDTPVGIMQVCRIIGAEALDTVMLKDGIHVMCVDDTGMIDGKPVNKKATALYWEKCGGHVVYTIHGDVFICPDSDYA